MMHDQVLSTSLWEEATNRALYIQNRSHHAFLEEKTSEEVFTSEKTYISHVGIFGSHVYIHKPKEKRTKMEPS